MAASLSEFAFSVTTPVDPPLRNAISTGGMMEAGGKAFLPDAELTAIGEHHLAKAPEGTALVLETHCGNSSSRRIFRRNPYPALSDAVISAEAKGVELAMRGNDWSRLTLKGFLAFYVFKNEIMSDARTRTRSA